MKIEDLNLAPHAEHAAWALKHKHPNVEFTSGRRTLEEQAHAMASNIVSSHDRHWIRKTYAAAAKLQHWVDLHSEAQSVDEIAAGLAETMKGISEADLVKISKHLVGMAFDVQPVVIDAMAIKDDIRQLPRLHKFLDKEGGQIRWHAQFW